MRKKYYNSVSRFTCNDIVEINSRVVSFSDVSELVDRSYFVPSTEAVKRIRNLGNSSMETLYDSDFAIKHGLTPEYVRHPSRDIVEVQRFTESAYAKVEESLKHDISSHEKKRLQAEKQALEQTKGQLDVILKDNEVVKKD